MNALPTYSNDIWLGIPSPFLRTARPCVIFWGCAPNAGPTDDNQLQGASMSESAQVTIS